MSPTTPENDPVQKGLHQLGRQIEEGAPPPSAAPEGPAEMSAESPVEKGLHELGRQIDDANRAGGRRRAKKTEAGSARRGPAHAARKPRSRKRTVAWVTGTVRSGRGARR